MRTKEQAQAVVYYMQCADTLRIKIGWSSSPERRLQEINQGSSTLVELLATEPGSQDDERRLHGMFAMARVAHLSSREWFYPVPPLLERVRDLGGTPRVGPVTPGATIAHFGSIGEREQRMVRAARELRASARDRDSAMAQVGALEDLVLALKRARHPRWPQAGYHHRGRGLISRRLVTDARELREWVGGPGASAGALPRAREP